MMFGMRRLRSSPVISGGYKPADASSEGRSSIQSIAAVGFAVALVAGIGATGRALLDPTIASPTSGNVVTIGAHVTTSDQWTERLTDPRSWRGGRYSGGRNVRRLQREEDEEEARERREEARERREELEAALRERREEEHEALRDRVRHHGTYRTVCVRLCDGSFYPISFSTTPENFARDEAACRSSCRTSARLYVYPNPGGEPEQMVSVSGQPYTALDTAFLFRTKYDAACTCKPHPWEQEALARHRAFAEAQRNRTTAKLSKSTPTQPGQPEQVATDDRRGERPEGAMLLGADGQPKSRAARGAEVRREAEPPRNQRGGNYGRRNDWQSRAFSDD